MWRRYDELLRSDGRVSKQIIAEELNSKREIARRILIPKILTDGQDLPSHLDVFGRVITTNET